MYWANVLSCGVTDDQVPLSEYRNWLVKWTSATTLVGSGREAAVAHACNLSTLQRWCVT